MKQQRRPSNVLRITAAVAVLAVLTAGCSDFDGATTTTAATTSTTTAPERGWAHDFLNTYPIGGGIQAAVTFTGDRPRDKEQIEAAFISQLRASDLLIAAETDVADFDDDQLIYFGYLYCVQRDAGIEIERALGTLVSLVAELRGRPVDGPIQDDYAAAFATAGHVAGTVCSTYLVETETYISSLDDA